MNSNNSDKNANKTGQEVTKTKQWCMVVDIAKCENCNNCFIACKDEHYGNDWAGYTDSQPLHGHRWMNILRKEHGEFPYIRVAYLPKPCFHCANAPCINKASDNQIYKRDDGIVIIDPAKAKGDTELIKHCPYGAIWWNEEKQTAQKCTLCAHLLDEGWKAPRCVQACPTGALTFHSINIDEFDNFIESNKLVDFGAEEGSENVPHHCVLYKNLDLYNCCFIAGSVAVKTEKIVSGENIIVEDCVANATVQLYKNNSLIAQTITDTFGDYRFDGLHENSGEYQIKITYDIINNSTNSDPEKHTKHTLIEVILKKSCFAGITWI
ncbi:MAG: oxidoreductase [Desulfamplus sp.]|nr:oxidoreductase [Desulfamplus sp.]